MFELSESIVAEILFAMENQNEESALVANSQNFSVVPFSEIDSDVNPDINPDDVYSLPKWFSSDGFNLLAEFTDKVHDLKVQSELKNVLANGRGVFKNFKNVLKNHAEIEAKFYLFKKKKMMKRISEWYDSLREGWGLGKSKSDALEDDSDIFFDDFIFKKYDFSTDENCVFLEGEKITDELKEEFPNEIGILLADLWNEKQNQNKISDSDKIGGFVCRTLSDEFVGCALFRVNSQCPTVARESSTLTTCFVKKNYRGLGIAKKLILSCVSDLQNRGFSTFFIADSLIPKSFEKVLTDLGFEKIRSAFVAKFI